MCEKSGGTSVDEGHDVESDVAEETMSAVVKFAKAICEPYDRLRNSSFVGFQVKKAGYTMRRAPSHAGWSRRQCRLTVDAMRRRVMRLRVF